MTFALPEGSILGRLRLDQVYEFYDTPRLFTVVNEVGNLLLGLSVVENSEQDAWLYIPMSAERLRTIEAGTLDIRTAFSMPETERVFYVWLDHETGRVTVDDRASTSLDRSLLPDDEAFFIEPVPQAVEQLAPVLDLAAQRHRETVRLALRFPGLSQKEAPSRSLGLVLTTFQELTAALAQSVRGEATARGRIPPDILTASELRVIDTFAASFGVELAAAQIGDLFGGSVAGDALNAMSDLIRAGSGAEELGLLLADLKPRVASKYRSFIETMIDVGAGVQIDWGSPQEGRGATHDLSQDALRQIASTIALVDSSFTTTYMIRGTLIGLNSRTRSFELEDSLNRQRVSGRLEQGRFPDDQEFVINAVYTATIRETVEVSGLTGDESMTRVLVSLERA